MALPTCQKCNNTIFTLSEFEPHGAAHKYQAITCSLCGCVIAVLPFLHTNTQIRELGAALGERLDYLASLVKQNQALITQLANRR